jgi:signal transduction histidine kinase
MNYVLEKSLCLVEHAINEHHIKTTKLFAEDIPDVEIDRNRIEQVFVNLLLNAINAMPDGGLLTIKTYAGDASASGKRVFHQSENLSSNEGGAVAVEIDDTGPGISKDISGRIFDPFFTTRRKTGGTGLGLSVVKTIMDLHHAQINIRNKNGGEKDGGTGTRATIVFKARGA